MKKYRLKEFDIANDIWIIQKRIFFFFWGGQFAMTGKERAQAIVNELNSR